MQAVECGHGEVEDGTDVTVGDLGIPTPRLLRGARAGAGVEGGVRVGKGTVASMGEGGI